MIGFTNCYPTNINRFEVSIRGNIQEVDKAGCKEDPKSYYIDQRSEDDGLHVIDAGGSESEHFHREVDLTPKKDHHTEKQTRDSSEDVAE